MSPSVAIIMRAKNEMPHVRNTLEMLQQQSVSADLFAVDSGSADGTLEALQNHGAALEQIQPEDYIPGPVLNQGIARTHHEIIVLLNADAIPQTTDWLERLIQPIVEKTADATFSKQIARPNAHFIVADDYIRAYSPANIHPGFFSAVACAFTRELWENHKFRDQGYAEDIAWAADCQTAGARFQFVEESIVEHSHNYTFKALRQKRFRQALTFNEAPNLGKQIYRCAREIARDLLRAIGQLKPQTIPYNIAYRITIHRAIFAALKERNT